MVQLLETSYTLLHPAAQNDDEAFVWITKIPHPLFNVIIRPKSTNNLISKDIPHSILVDKNDTAIAQELTEKNYQYLMTATVMHWKVQAIEESNYPIELATMDAFGFIAGKTFQLEEKIINAFTDLLQSTNAENYVIHLNNEPVGTGTLISNGKIGGIYNIATLSESQKKGCGNAMMRHLMARAKKLDLEYVVLLSSPAGLKLYSDLGFKVDLELDLYC